MTRPSRSHLAAALILAGGMLAAPVATVIAQEATPAAGQTVTPGGIDLANMDLAANPGVDFNQFVNGGWLATAEIRPDRSRTGSFDLLSDEMQRYLIGLLDEKAADPALDPVSDEGKAVAYFAQGMDLEARDAAGVEPIRPMLDRIAAIGSLDDYYRYQQGSIFDKVSGVLGMGVGTALDDADRHALYLGGPYLGLPNRDYYLDEAIGTPEIVASYNDTNAKLLEFAGYDPADAERLAPAVFDFERALAEPTLTREEQQDANRFNNPFSLADLQAAYPAIDWTAYQETLGIPVQETIIVTETRYLDAVDDVLAATDVETIKAYLALELMWENVGLLSDEIGETAFEFAGRTLSGREQRSPLDERVLAGVQGAFGQAVGKLYVAERFSPEAKAEMERLTQDIIAAFRVRLEAADWMTPETKTKALDKLANLGVKVGYPDEWETYEDIELGSTYADTNYNAFRAELREDLDDITEPVDRDKWNAPPQTINAFYSPTRNEIVFPAGILQAPFFDLNADPAVNYGGIGFVIGHEITHGFDLQGSRFGPTGNLENWWTEEDRVAFDALNEQLAAQYAEIEVLPGAFINGQLTVTENAADLGGIQVAWDALQMRLAEEGQATPIAAGVIELEPPFTPEQQFYISAATIWRQKIRDQALKTQLDSGVHSPGSVRAVQPLRNHDPFFDAFGITEEDPLWLAPDDRVVIW
jgi:putative endopeptidase